MAPRLPPELRLVLEAEALKRTPRAGWKRIGVARPESVADHSWRLALMAMLYADLLGLDAGRAARIALLHDLAEARIGDRMPGEWSAKQKHAREARALRGMLAPLPPGVRRRWLALWNDYEAGRSPEARLVAELDKLEMVAQGLAYERRGEARRADLDPFWGTAERAIASAAVRARLGALRGRRPHAGGRGASKPTSRRASSNSGKGLRTSRKRYSRAPRTR
jgi:putative hydrolase of HD superfamily